MPGQSFNQQRRVGRRYFFPRSLVFVPTNARPQQRTTTPPPENQDESPEREVIDLRERLSARNRQEQGQSWGRNTGRRYFFPQDFEIRTRSTKKYTIIGDSMVRHIRAIKTLTQSVSGLNPQRCISGIRNGSIHVENFNVILLHIGVADLKVLFPDEFIDSYIDLITEIRRKNRQAKIVVSGIIASPCDYVYIDLDQNRCHFNQELKFMCQNNRFEFLETYKRFVNRRTKAPLKFLFKLDRRHLNRDGIDILKGYLGGSIARIGGSIRE